MSSNIETILSLHRIPYFLFTYIDNALLIDIESTSFLHLTSSFLLRTSSTSHRYRVDIMSKSYPFFLVNIVDITILINTESTSFLHLAPSYLFTSSTLQCCQTSSRHRTMIDNQSRSHLHWVNLFHLMYIVDIAMLAIVKSTLRFAFCEW